MKLKFGQPIRVSWIDACGSGGGWKPPLTEGEHCVNVGIFVLQNKNGLCFASGYSEKDPELVLEPSFIPKGMVKKIERLK